MLAGRRRLWLSVAFQRSLADSVRLALLSLTVWFRVKETLALSPLRKLRSMSGLK